MSWIGCARKWLQPEFRYDPGVCLEKHRKTTTNLSQDGWSLGQDLNVGFFSTKQESTLSDSDVQWECSLMEETNFQTILANQ
jgi:hypothetical protein